MKTDHTLNKEQKELLDYITLIIIYDINATHTIEKHVKKYKVQHQPILQSTKHTK